MKKQRKSLCFYIPVKINLIYEKHTHHLMVYFCVVCIHVDRISTNTKDYNTQVITKIKRKKAMYLAMARTATLIADVGLVSLAGRQESRISGFTT